MAKTAGPCKRRIRATAGAVLAAAVSLAAASQVGATHDVLLHNEPPQGEKAKFQNCHEIASGVPTVPFEVAQDYVDKDSGSEDYDVGPPGPTGPTGPTDTIVPSTPAVSLLFAEFRCDNVTVNETEPLGTVSMALGWFDLKDHPRRREGEVEHDDDFPGHAYLLFWLTDSKPFGDWLKNGTHLEAHSVPSKHFVYEYPFIYSAWPLIVPAEHWFSFTAASPGKWAYTRQGGASVQHQAPAPLFLGSFWQDRKMEDGTTFRTRIALSDHVDWIASTRNMTIQATKGSQLAKIFGTGAIVDSFAGSVLIDEWSAVKKTYVNP